MTVNSQIGTLRKRKGILPKWLDSKERAVLLLLSIIAVAYLALGQNLLLNIAVIVCFVVILARCGIEDAIVSYLFLMFWERFTTLPVFSSVSLIVVILGLASAFAIIKNRVTVTIGGMLTLVIVGIYGLLCLLLTKKPDGILMLFNVIIALYARHIWKGYDGAENRFWKKAFFFIFVSCCFSFIWGIIRVQNGDAATLYLQSQYPIRASTTIGTDRSCMLFCTAMIYPIFYMKQSVWRVLLIIALVVANLLTISITAIVCLGLFSVVIFYDRIKNARSNKKYAIILLVMVLVAAIVYAYNYKTGLSVVDNITTRLHNIFSIAESGDLAKATTGRTDIASWYLDIFNESGLFHQLFGNANIGYYSEYAFTNFSHNTYLDMLLYFGIIPTAVLLIVNLVNIYQRRRIERNMNYAAMKVAFLVTAFSVSALTSNCWWFIFVI